MNATTPASKWNAGHVDDIFDDRDIYEALFVHNYISAGATKTSVSPIMNGSSI